MASDPSLYAGSGALLKEYLMAREASAKPRGRYVYGSLEYPYTFTAVQPDKTSISNAFPPGRFHQDTYVGNPDLFKFYTNTLAPLFNSTQSFFFHLDDSICERDAALNLDVAILALLSHRCVLMSSSHLSNFHTHPVLRRTGHPSERSSPRASTQRTLITIHPSFVHRTPRKSVFSSPIPRKRQRF